MFCKHCGKEIIEGAAFCNNCGAKVSDFDEQETDYEIEKTPIKKLPYVVLAVVVGVIALLIYIGKNFGSGETVNNSVEVGDTVKFGVYEQDNNTSNGPEAIVWDVVAKEGENYMLLSHYVLDKYQYETVMSSLFWERSELHTWLNSAFMMNAFDDSEKQMLASDVTLLSLSDIEEYFNPTALPDYGMNVFYSGKLACAPTAYAAAMGVGSESIEELTSDDSPYNTSLFKAAEKDVPEDCKSNIAEGWFLKDISTRQNMVYAVSHIVTSDGAYAGDRWGIRPVVWVHVP